MSLTAPTAITIGNMVTLSTTVQSRDPVTGVLTPTTDPGIKLYVSDPDGDETIYDTSSTPAVQYAGTPRPGFYYLELLPNKVGLWNWRWLGDATAQGASEGDFLVESHYLPPNAPVDLTDLRVLVPHALRACEGPYGPPPDKPPLTAEVLYPRIADACAEIILFAGSLFGHQLKVTKRDPIVGFPIAWATDVVLTEWEGAAIICQVALDYWRFFLRDMRTSVTMQNEGSEYSWTLSANVIRDYLQQLVSERDKALLGLRAHNFIIDRYWSNIRVRDQATIALLEWWDVNSPGMSGGGMPGGQEAAVIPWTPGWSAPGVFKP